MLGAIIGDYIGSVYERFNRKSTDFPLFRDDCKFTDDTILTLAVADAFMNKKDYATTIAEYARKYPNAGYGGSFINWVDSGDLKPYNSWGNGSAMRVSSIGWLCDSYKETIEEAKRSAEVTHNHPEGIKGAQTIAACIFWARNGHNKDQIRTNVYINFDYDLNRTIDEIRPTYEFDVSCQGSVPEAIIAFLESNDFEDCIRKAISIGGDSDTIAAMAGSIAEAFYGEGLGNFGGIPFEIGEKVMIEIEKDKFLDPVFLQFYETIHKKNLRDKKTLIL